LDLSRRGGRGDIWLRQGELLENRVYNKPNDCSATEALAPGPDHQQQQQQQQRVHGTIFLFNSWSLGSSLLLELVCACFRLSFSSPVSFRLLFITSFIFIYAFTYFKVRTFLCILVIQTSNPC
jgi:hypothetical protein